jgi:Tol biopolymer transport system component
LQRIPPGQTKPQPFLKAGREGEIFVNPVWLGDRLVVASTYPIMRDGRYVDQGNEIVAIDPASGQRTVLAESAIEPAPSADGRWLAYTTIDPRTYEQSLALLEVGTGRTRVVVDERSGLRTLRAPALSPDGSSLAFAAWGNLVEGPRRGSWWNPFDPPVASAHGVPEDLYLLNINEGTFRKLTKAPKDDPTPAFSPDGSKLAVLSADGVYLMPVAGGQLSQISGSGGVGSIVWAP